jgi:molybdenum cofactor cytidylyltransferase
VSDKDKRKGEFVAIILAAGSSSRMGQSKQLLKVGGESLLRKTINAVRDSPVDQIAVVLGADLQMHQKEIADLPVHSIFNADWEKGMGSSLKSGLRLMEERYPACEAVLVTVCDQPLLTAVHVEKLISTYQSGKKPIVASCYSDSPGVPVLFGRLMFKKLYEMDDRHGAKKIIKDAIELTSLVDFPEGAIDLDTLDDWKNFTQSG